MKVLTYADRDFIFSIKDRKSLDPFYKLKNINYFLLKLHPAEFVQSEILNLHLVNYMIENNNKYKEQLSSVLMQLSNETKQSIEFIDIFINEYNNKNNIQNFIKLIIKNWTNIWIYIFKQNQIILKKK